MKIEASFVRKTLAPKFKDVFPGAFSRGDFAKSAVTAGSSAVKSDVVPMKPIAKSAKPVALEAVAPAKHMVVSTKSVVPEDEGAKAEARVKLEAEARAKAKAEAAVRAKMEAAVRAKMAAEAKPKDSTMAEGAVVGQQGGGAVHKASKDSKGIRIVVQGKGKTKDAAVRWAIRDAAWKTVGKWVDSKARIKENHDKVVAQVKTITEADVPKFEVIDTQMQDGGYVVKVRVSVSKKKIAPKFAEIFPDVFGNVND